MDEEAGAPPPTPLTHGSEPGAAARGRPGLRGLEPGGVAVAAPELLGAEHRLGEGRGARVELARDHDEDDLNGHDTDNKHCTHDVRLQTMPPGKGTGGCHTIGYPTLADHPLNKIKKQTANVRKIVTLLSNPA